MILKLFNFQSFLIYLVNLKNAKYIKIIFCESTIIFFGLKIRKNSCKPYLCQLKTLKHCDARCPFLSTQISNIHQRIKINHPTWHISHLKNWEINMVLQDIIAKTVLKKSIVVPEYIHQHETKILFCWWKSVCNCLISSGIILESFL